MKKDTNKSHGILIRMSILTLLVLISQIFVVRIFINRAIENNEARKVGGIENYETLKKLYDSERFADAQQQQIQSALSQWGSAQPDQQADTQEEFPSGQLTADQITQIKEGAFIDGNEGAKITIIEYSDPECPFCIRHYNDGTIKNVMDKYDGNVNHVLKLVEGVNHDNTQSKSLALLCAGDLGGVDAYYGLYDKIMSESSPSTPVANSKVAGFAQDLGINQANFQSCVDNKTLLSTYSANWQEAIAFKSTGTPGNLIINNETGEYRLVSGAYPVDTFVQIIDQWMN